MPFKSKAQRRKFAQLLVEGKISDETYEEWNRSTGGKELPERVKPAKKRKSARKVKAKRARPKPKAMGIGSVGRSRRIARLRIVGTAPSCRVPASEATPSDICPANESEHWPMPLDKASQSHATLVDAPHV